MQNKILQIIYLSDVHLGLKKVPAKYIIENIIRMLLEMRAPQELDYFYIAGDLFEEQLALSDRDVLDIQTFIIYLLQFCNSYNIKLRILEGTPLHDRKQSKQLEMFNSAMSIADRANLIYVDKVDILYEEEDDIYVLYVPDKAGTATEVWDKVTALLRQKGIDKVDYAIMHGMFEYNLPEFLGPEHHSSKNYLSIVRKYIDIGHIHGMRVMFKRIIGNGSVDRLRHGEEEDKGFFHVISHPETFENDEVTFMVNKNAMPFVTIDVTDYDPADMSEYIVYRIEDLPDGAHVRLHMNNDEISSGIYRSFTDVHCRLNWDNKITRDKISDLMHDDTKELVTEDINPETISGQVVRMMADDDMSQVDIDTVTALLATYI